MMSDESAEIARTLTDAYAALGTHPAAAAGSALLAEVARILATYTETSKVVPREVVSTDDMGLVLATESAHLDGQPKSWEAIHLWRIGSGHVLRFEAYVQSLIVTLP